MNHTATVGTLFDAYELYCYHYYAGKKCLSAFLSRPFFPQGWIHLSMTMIRQVDLRVTSTLCVCLLQSNWVGHVTVRF